MKASEIIEQIAKTKVLVSPENISAIMQYLDEERERVNGILHILVDTVKSNCAISFTQFNEIHNMIDELSASAAKGSE